MAAILFLILVKRPLSGMNVVCKATVAMALQDNINTVIRIVRMLYRINIGLLTFAIVKSNVRSPMQSSAMKNKQSSVRITMELMTLVYMFFFILVCPCPKV